jgi:hypothetical protein
MNFITKILSIDNRARMFWSLALVVVLSLGVYVYAVLATVHYTVLRERLALQGESLSERVSELEFEKIALKNDVNIEKALGYGFAEVKNPIYISRTESALTLNTQK